MRYKPLKNLNLALQTPKINQILDEPPSFAAAASGPRRLSLAQKKQRLPRPVAVPGRAGVAVSRLESAASSGRRIALAKDFLNSIHYKNKGIMLDLSHLLATSTNIHTMDQAGEYILRSLDKMGELVDHIKGIHINKSIPGGYLLENHAHKYQQVVNEKDPLEQYYKIMDHIKTIDWHVPYDDHSLDSIIS